MENKTNGLPPGQNEITIKELPPMRVASSFSTSRNPEMEVISFMERWAKNHGLDFRKLRKFGFDVPVSEQQRQFGLRSYEFWVTVPDNIMPSEGVKIRSINSSTYAVMRIKNPFANPQEMIPSGWQKLLEWVMSHKDVRQNTEAAETEREKYMLEEIIETGDGVCVDLYFPME
jgi:AraC family transcriptional regulator